MSYKGNMINNLKQCHVFNAFINFFSRHTFYSVLNSGINLQCQQILICKTCSYQIQVCYKIIKFLLNLCTMNCSELFHFCLKLLSCLCMITRNFCLDIGKTFGTTIVQIRNEVLGFVQILVDQVKSIPIVTNFKEQYKHVSKHFILIFGK